jgi:hypothetical protein
MPSQDLKSQQDLTHSPERSRRLVVLLCLIFLLAFFVRTLTWQDNRREALRMQSSVTSSYKDYARPLARGDFKVFASDTTHFGHPPGYPIVLAAIFKTIGESDTAIQFIQITLDSFAVIVLILIAAELTPFNVAVLAGLLSAVSPQFAYFSVLLLPDSLAVLPILVAIYSIVRATKTSNVYLFLFAGALIGVSCWLRANALLLAPFLACLLPLIVQKKLRLSAPGAILVGTALVIAPVTIKNAIVFHRFVPLSLGAGQTLLEGIADYDKAGRFNIPSTDLGIQRQEAEWSGKPEYAILLFGADGIDRERMRLARGFRIIWSDPIWFAGVIARRAINSCRLDPVPRLEVESPASYQSLNLAPVWRTNAMDLPIHGVFAKGVQLTTEDESLRLKTSGDDYEDQFVSEAIRIQPHYDYVIQLPVKLEQGRVILKVIEADGPRALASRVIDINENFSASAQPTNHVSIPFVSSGRNQVRFTISHNAANSTEMVVGQVALFQVGPTSFEWLRYLRLPIRLVQLAFKTSIMTPLVLIGLGLLVLRRQWKTVSILLAVPAYYLLVQSVLHTERRYVYVIHFFFLILASVTLVWLYGGLRGLVMRVK